VYGLGYGAIGLAVNNLEVLKEIVCEQRALEDFLRGDYEKGGNWYHKVSHTCCTVSMGLFSRNLVLIDVIKGKTTLACLILFCSK
jgi:hypothetical protein